MELDSFVFLSYFVYEYTPSVADTHEYYEFSLNMKFRRIKFEAKIRKSDNNRNRLSLVVNEKSIISILSIITNFSLEVMTYAQPDLYMRTLISYR